jgi:branched-chain amino acid transport system substrate-binding protein
MSGLSVKDPTDPTWANDKGVQDYLALMKTYYPDGDPANSLAGAGYGLAQSMVYILEQCGDNLTPDNLMHQATHMHDVEFPLLLPGIKVNTSPTNYRGFNQMQLVRFDGKRWVPFGEIISE